MTDSTRTEGPLASSFRDPAGFLFRRHGTLYRQVNSTAAADLDLLHGSGLYDELIEKELLVPHREVDLDLAPAPGAVRVLQPDEIPFISYPYEWCFSQLKDAALATLRIQRLALRKGLVLKDASAFNVQFHRGRPVFIDTLSFTAYREGSPWAAYRQFCQHFLAPLALMARIDVRLGSMLRPHLDGVPLDLAAKLLPWRTRLNPGLAMHLHMHAGSQKKHESDPTAGRNTTVNKRSLDGIMDSLRTTVRKLNWRPGGTEWGDYYAGTNYTDEALNRKRDLVAAMLDRTPEGRVLDAGANNGFFSRVASERGRPTVAADIDPAAVEMNWLACRKGREPDLLPLLMDLTNPSPALGWHHRERDSLLGRGPAETVLALALIHHLAISNNVPLPRAADFFADLGRHLIIEFVPKSDSQVRRLLATRPDIFPDYTLDGFTRAFEGPFEIMDTEPIEGTERVLCLMRTRSGQSSSS